MGTTKEIIGKNLGPKPPPNGEGGNPFVAKEESLLDPRKERIEWWRTAPERVYEYESGNFFDESGNFLYSYQRGSTLIMGEGEDEIQVMDTCQTPWAEATVDRAFEELGIKNRPIKVLERGFGMGIIASRIIQSLGLHGGNYTVIELNEQDAEFAKGRWKPNQLSALTRFRTIRGIRSNHNVDINIIPGEAYEETAKLAQALAEKPEDKFDIIISDTYPLTEDERGMNDLLDLETLKQCLKPDGVFAFFAHFPGSTEDVAYKQASIITEHFRNYSVSRANINPPPHYKYLQPETGPIRSLPVVICKNPIL